MHPPTLVVTARVSPDDGSLRTTVLAMPNITTQTYETGKDFPSAVSAGVGIAAASPIGIPTGLPLVAHTSPRPFTVPIVAKYRVAAVPTVPHRATALNLHYHFVTRPGVNVKVMPTDALSAEVEIHMDPATYQPFSDANCRKETVGLESFDAQAHEPEGTVRAIINSIATAVPLPGVIITLNAGMQVAKCEVPNPTPGTPGTVNDNASVIDASQPYPVYGWLSYD
jgi:hypothetical protein